MWDSVYKGRGLSHYKCVFTRTLTSVYACTFFQCCVHVLWYDNCGEETLWIDGVVYILYFILIFYVLHKNYLLFFK